MTAAAAEHEKAEAASFERGRSAREEEEEARGREGRGGPEGRWGRREREKSVEEQ